MISPLSAFDQLPTTKESADIMIQRITEEVKSGNVDPLKLRLFFKNIERVISEVVENCEEEILKEAEKYGKSFELGGAKVEIKHNGARFDYSLTQDPVLPRLKAASEEAQNKQKEREKFLQGIPEEGLEITDDETGEMIRIYRPFKAGGKIGLTITLDKGGKK